MQRIFVIALLGLVACDNNSGDAQDLSVPEDMSAVADLRTPPDLSENPDFSGISCGLQSCNAMTQECCAVVGSGGLQAMCVAAGTCDVDGGASVVGCDGPEDCGGGAPLCCATLGGSGGSDLGISGSGSAMCVANCMVKAAGSGTGLQATTRLCHANSDCANAQGPVTIPPGVVPQLPQGGTIVLAFNSCCRSDDFPGIEFCAPMLASTALMLTCR